MGTTIISAATNSDPDTGSYFELAARAALACVERSGVGLDEVGMLVNAGVFRDRNISEPAVSALIQKRIGLGLAYEAERAAAFSFDLMHGATGLLHALVTADSFLATGAVRYALLVAGDTHPSTRRHVAGFPYSAGGAALLLGTSPTAGGFGQLHFRETTGVVDPTAWVALDDAGADGRSAMRVRAGAEDPVALATAAVRSCLDAEGLDGADFAEGTRCCWLRSGISDSVPAWPTPSPSRRHRSSVSTPRSEIPTPRPPSMPISTHWTRVRSTPRAR
ncbi:MULTISPECIES: beta-ketoacyl-[acyl-carrier-protein] synthase family protein [Nocardia]|uniref:hypothetical protein n=1 Tax=Nocardia abscessus TaxID=120957 RepID=UPI001894A2FA|nr:hypothetical protein [Nocardia abscessus]MBF6475045.1 hypothetical protein [Nocardia abscessus]